MAPKSGRCATPTNAAPDLGTCLGRIGRELRVERTAPPYANTIAVVEGSA
jgi:hypothetical protein